MKRIFSVCEAMRGALRIGLSTMLLVGLAAFASAQKVSKVTLLPTSVVGGVNSVGTVVLDGKAGADGVNVVLSALSTYATVPQSVIVAKGKTSATFTITTSPVPTNTPVTISAMTGDFTKSATLTLKAPTLVQLDLNPVQVSGGTNATGRVKLSSPAPGDGLNVNLSSNQGAATVNTTVTVGAGATTATFPVTTSSVATKTVAKITASLGSTLIGVTLTINPPVISKLVLDPSTVTGGTNSIGNITLSGPAPTNGLTIKLGATGNAATVPATVIIESGSTSGSFSITTTAVKAKTTSTIGAKLGTAYTTAVLTINASPINKFAGSYAGSVLTSSGGISSVDLVVSAAGAITGKSVDGLGGTTSSLTGTIDNSGNCSITVVNTQGTNSNTGTFTTLTGSIIQGVFPESGGNGKTYVTLNVVGKPLMFQGNYKGTFNDGQNGTGNVTMTVSASGQISGSFTGTGGNGTVKGSVNAEGVASLKVTNANGTQTKAASSAFGSGGSPLIIIVINPGSVTNTTLTLTKQ